MISKDTIMKSVLICLVIVFSFCCSACMYNGNLEKGFYIHEKNSSRLPLKAYLVFDNTIENYIYQAQNIYFKHGVRIEVNPGLKTSMISAFQSTFDTLYVAEKINPESISNYDVLIFPRIERVGRVVTISIIMKEAANGKIINTYRRSENIFHKIPISVHILSSLNIIPFSGLTTPIFAPINTEIIGAQAEKEVADNFKKSLTAITDDIKNDQLLTAHAGFKNPKLHND